MTLRPLTIPLSALMLSAGCSRGDVPIEPPPAALVEPCQRPQRVPLRALTESEVVIPWGRDRVALEVCGDRHAALVGWVEQVIGAR